MSYQDVDWGPADWMPITDEPMTLTVVRMVLEKFEYRLAPGWPEQNWLTFTQGDKVITILPPDFKDRRTGHPCYERETMIDMLSRALADPGTANNHESVGLKIIAVLEASDSCDCKPK
jgi:hypothetical protein